MEHRTGIYEVTSLWCPLDASELAIISRARDLHRSLLGTDKEFPSDSTLTNAGREFVVVYIAASAATTIGYLSVDSVYGEPWWYLKWLLVADLNRGLGIGTRLLHECAADALSRHVPLLLADPLSDRLEELTSYYEERGFVPATPMELSGLDGYTDLLAGTPTAVHAATRRSGRL